MQASDLAVATAVHKLERAPGWYVADLSDDWSYITPSGGVLMTVAMRAMSAELGDPSMHPLSANTHFCSPVPSGPLEIRVEVLRRGHAATQLRAALSSSRQPGPGLEVSATYVRERQGPEVHGIDMPDVPPPDEAEDIDDRSIASDERPSGRPFFANYDIKLAHGVHLWRPGWQAGEAHMAYWYRYRVPQRSADGLFDPLAIPPIADTMPGALARKLGPQARFYAPSLDLTVHFLDPSDAEWFLVDVRALQARAGYASASAHIWDDKKRLVANTTQTMMLRARPKE
jgi:acyl-CoA thioesterase